MAIIKEREPSEAASYAELQKREEDGADDSVQLGRFSPEEEAASSPGSPPEFAMG